MGAQQVQAQQQEDLNLSFDWEAHASVYRGHARTRRLLFVSTRLPEAARASALKEVLSEAKADEDLATYREAAARLEAGGHVAGDAAWLSAADARAAARLAKLESELNGYRNNLIKESIRMGHHDLGEFHYERGDLKSALKCFVRTRDFCTTAKHIVGMCLSVVRVSIEMGNYLHVANYVQKAEATPEVGTDPMVAAKLAAAAGLAQLAQRKYKAAARTLCGVPAELGNSYNDVIAPTDIATYGAICALATFERSELKTRVLDSVSFRSMLELTPSVRELVGDFYASRYASCLDSLRTLKADLKMDIHLHDHVDALYAQIRQRALIQYATPFSSVELSRMATAFHTTVAELQKELAALIADGKINARIDSHGGVLYARRSDKRASTFAGALKAGQSYEMETCALLLRGALLRHNVIVTKNDRRACS